MSRSYKHNTYVTDGSPNSTKESKRIAAQRLRRIPVDSEKSEVLVNKPSNFKKINRDTYDIHDYKMRDTVKAAKQRWNAENEDGWIHSRYKNLDDYLNHWSKWHLRK